MTNPSGKISKDNPLKPAAYQLVPLIKLLRNGFGAILISDGVGVGKTISAGYLLSYFQEALSRPALVISPPMLIDKWLLELRQKFDIKSIPIRSVEELPTAISETLETKKAAKLTYVMASSLLSQNESFDFKDLSLVVYDEIHNYRNSDTLSYRTALRLSERSRNRVGLSATPINNSIEDLVSELSILIPAIGRELLEVAVKDAWERDCSIITSPLATRFTKERLGIHFARRIIEQHKMAYPAHYNAEVLAKIEARQKEYERRASFFDDVTYFRMAASSPVAISRALDCDFQLKNDPKLDAFTRIIERSKSSHILAFVEFQDTATYLGKKVENRECYIITGSVPLFERQSLIEAFKQSKKAILIMTPVGTEGLDLQFCDTLINYDLHWNPMKIEQRIGRIDRIGQEKHEISVLNLVVEDSIDARVISVLEKKLRVIAKSVFETAEIISPVSSGKPMLADASAIEKETSAGQSLISAIGLSQKMPESDYEVLKYVKIEYCYPAATRDAGRRNLRGECFLEYCEPAEDWLRLNDDKMNQLTDLVGFYR